WVVLSVLWIGGVGVATWKDLPREESDGAASDPTSKENLPDAPWVTKPAFDPTKPYVVIPNGFNPEEFNTFKRRAVIEKGTAFALIPPVFALALGVAFIWVVRGFQRR